jgi:hypothetical protein
MFPFLLTWELNEQIAMQFEEAMTFLDDLWNFS